MPGDVARPGLKVVVALHLSATSGPARTLAPVIRSLAGQGAEIVVAVPGHGHAADELSDAGRIAPLGHAPLILPRGAREAWSLPARFRSDVRRFRALLRRERADVAIVATTTLPALTAAARLEGVPSVVYATELYRRGDGHDGMRAAAGRAVMRLNARLASVTVASSQAVAEEIDRPARTLVVNPSIDPFPAEGDAAAFRERHGLPAGGPCLATLGNITRGRGQDVAIRALADVRRDHPGAHLVIAGEPFPRDVDRRFRAELLDLARELGVGDAVHLCGFVRPADLFATCDVWINPTRAAETFGRAAMEALVAGRPVISARTGAIGRLLEHERHALLVPPDRPDLLAAAVRRLLADPALAGRLAADGAAHVRASFTAAGQLDGFGRALDRALAGTGRARG